MKLQSKVTLIIAGAWLAICLIIYADSKWIIAANYQHLERSNVQIQVSDVLRAYHRSLLTLQMYTTAWAVWDEAYSFMKTKDQKFISENFVPGTFVSSNLNFFMFYTTQGSLFYGSSFNLATNKMMPVPSSLLDYIEDNKYFLRHDDVASKKIGIIDTKDGLIMMASLPVLTGDQKGPVRGALLMGYYLNDRYFNTLSDTVGLKLSFISMDVVRKSPELEGIFTRIIQDPSNDITIVNENLARGYVVLQDIANNPVGMIAIDVPRVIYQQGISTAYHYFMIVVVLGLFVIALTWFMLKKIVLNRVLSISRQVQYISRGSLFNKKIHSGGDDELSSMVVSINSLIKMIDNSQKQLTYLATHDSLTELPNRDLFYDLLSHAMIEAERGNYRLAVFFLDMDKFKLVNDKYGHHVGDKLLQLIARRLKNAVRAHDVVARQSGDEFIIMMNHVTDVSHVSKFADNILAISAKPFNINEIEIMATFSIGISIYNGDTTSAAEIMRQADEAMYAAKKIAGNTYRLYDKKIFQEG